MAQCLSAAKHASNTPVNVKPHLPQVGQRWGFAMLEHEIPHPLGQCCCTNSLLIPTPLSGN